MLPKESQNTDFGAIYFYCPTAQGIPYPNNWFGAQFPSYFQNVPQFTDIMYKQPENPNFSRYLQSGSVSSKDLLPPTAEMLAIKPQPPASKPTQAFKILAEEDPVDKNAEKTESKYGCRCIKTKCNKEYCACFKNGEFCNKNCKCLRCRNVDKKHFIQRKGKPKCFCQKSKCSNKYCECVSAGGKCGEECGCIDCKNVEIVSPEQKQEQIKSPDIQNELHQNRQ